MGLRTSSAPGEDVTSAMNPDIEQLVARLWPGQAVGISPLAGGITNSNYLVELAKERVVLRIPGKDSELLGIDRQSELLATQIAARIGIAPPVVVSDPASGAMASRFLEARAVEPAELSKDPLLAETAAALRRVHHAGTVPTVFDPFATIMGYHHLAADRSISEPFDFARCLSIVERFQKVRPWHPTVLGHNDLLNANLLFDQRLRLIDWEYAGMADPYFDLANLSANHDFNQDADRTLLGHYFGESTEVRLAVLSLMKLVSELREAMWGVVQMAISELEVDFAAYANERVDRFEALLSGIDVEGMLELAAQAPGGSVP